LWAKYFDAPRSPSSNLVPTSWKEFFIAFLLNPSSFDWTKSFLSSVAWSIIMPANDKETAIFVVPAKCPVKRKLECVCIGEDQETEQDTLLEPAKADQAENSFEEILPESHKLPATTPLN
jgi:hypothetical protein